MPCSATQISAEVYNIQLEVYNKQLEAEILWTLKIFDFSEWWIDVWPVLVAYNNAQ
jgi:hypothetical protein